MQAYLQYFLEEVAFPEEARGELTAALDKVLANTETAEKFNGLLAQYDEKLLCDYGQMLAEMKEISALAGVHEYTGALLLPICLTKRAKAYYQEKGYDEKIWKTTFSDLRYKAEECKLCHNVWGTNAGTWFAKFFHLCGFGFEKLQFHFSEFGNYSAGKAYTFNGREFLPSTKVIAVHIPRTGTPLDKEGKERAYQQAKAFFNEHFWQGEVLFFCRSWLLFPKHKEILNPASNLYSFIDDFTLIDSGEYPDYSQLWRLMDGNYTDWRDMPQKTSLQRAYVEMVKKGEKTGWGFGYFAL